jgi:Mediator complex subunit 23.
MSLFPFSAYFFFLQNLIKPQKDLLRYVIAQTYSREMVCAMLGLKKQVRKPSPNIYPFMVHVLST